MTFSANGTNLFLLVGDGGNQANSQDPTQSTTARSSG